MSVRLSRGTPTALINGLVVQVDDVAAMHAPHGKQLSGDRTI